MLDDSRVVARRELRRAGTACEPEQLGETKAAVATNARIRRLTARVTVDEGPDDRATKLLAQIKRHVWNPERVAGRTRREHRLRRTACAFGIGPVRIEPQPQRHADRVR